MLHQQLRTAYNKSTIGSYVISGSWSRRESVGPFVINRLQMAGRNWQQRFVSILVKSARHSRAPLSNPGNLLQRKAFPPESMRKPPLVRQLCACAWDVTLTSAWLCKMAERAVFDRQSLLTSSFLMSGERDAGQRQPTRHGWLIYLPE